MPGIEARAPERTETSSGLLASPNFLPVMRPTSVSAASTWAFSSCGYFLPLGVEIGADLGGDGEAGRHRQAELRHLGEAGALAAEQIAHLAAPLSLAAAERVNPPRPRRRLFGADARRLRFRYRTRRRFFVRRFCAPPFSPARVWLSGGIYASAVWPLSLPFNATLLGFLPRHCEERSDEAIQAAVPLPLDCFAEPVIGPATSGRTRWLAMTVFTG